MKPLLRLFIALMVALVICQLTFLVFRKGLRNFNIHKTERLTEIFNGKTNFDLIFIGSSRTHTSIHPGIIDSICNINSYNAGVEGGNLYEFKLTLDGFLVNHPPPKYLVLTLDIQSFDLRRKLFNYTQYFPYLNNPVIKERLKESGHNMAVLSVLPFVEMTAYDDYTRGNILKGLAGKTEIPAGDFQYKGYLSNTMDQLSGAPNDSVKPVTKAPISIKGYQILMEIIETCKNKNIRLLFTYAPEYAKRLQKTYIDKEQFFQTVSDVSHTHNIPFLRHDELALCQDPKLYANVGHVNKVGAELYSKILGQQLDSIINIRMVHKD